MSHSMKTFLFFQVSLVLCVLSQSQKLYIDQSVPISSSQQDGSRQYPFPSLTAAFNTTSGYVLSQSDLKEPYSVDYEFLGQSYTVSQNETFAISTKQETVISITAPEGFVLRFEDPAQIMCYNYPQAVNEDPVKNVKISFTGFIIEGWTSLPLFYGSCYFTFENFYINELRTTLLTTMSEGSALLKNFTINDVILTNQYLIDQDSRQRIEADYLKFENVYMKNTVVNADGQVSAVIMSFLQYALIEVRNSELYGIGFSIKGEQIGGNNKTDIYVSDSMMSDAETFLYIESYGIVLIENTTFNNASNRAVYFLLADENLSPILATFKDCLFSNNMVKYAGGALTFQSSKETNYQLYMNTIITGCNFTNNTASFSGGAIALLFFQNANVTVEDSVFSSNTAIEAGGAIYIDKGESTMIIVIRNSHFETNSAFAGGVFNFDFLDGAQITLENNNYVRNFAKLEGGIGYLSESKVTLTDTNSLASNNAADFQGGAWSLESESEVTFQNVSFMETKAFFRGGCITNSGASLTLKQTSFENCTLSAVSSMGGALFVGEDAIVNVDSSVFTNNLAEFGASFAIQSSREESQVFNSITIASDLNKISQNAPTIKSQIMSGPGDLTLQSVQVSNLQSPFLLQQAGKVLVQNVVLQGLRCDAQDASLSFCLFGVEKNEDEDDPSLTVQNFELQNFSSTVPLLTSEGASVALTSVKIDQMKLPDDVPVWDIQISTLKIENMEIINLAKNFVRSVKSDMEIASSNFEAQMKGGAGSSQPSDEYDLVPNSR